ncbi:MAG TPA: DUF5667 domain-containing protein [Candidatus Paceibacterota bacterium]
MKDKFEQIIEGTRQVSLTPREKADLRGEVENMTRKRLGWPAYLALVLLLGTGVSFAAEGALPGDALYAVKTSFNENLRGSLTFSREARANWQARIVERRLEEAAELALAGKLDADTEARLASELEEHAREARELGDEKVDARLSAALSAHTDAIASADTGSGTSGAVMMSAKIETGTALELELDQQAGTLEAAIQELEEDLKSEEAQINAIGNTEIDF